MAQLMDLRVLAQPHSLGLRLACLRKAEDSRCLSKHELWKAHFIDIRVASRSNIGLALVDLAFLAFPGSFATLPPIRFGWGFGGSQEWVDATDLELPGPDHPNFEAQKQTVKTTEALAVASSLFSMSRVKNQQRETEIQFGGFPPN